MGPATSYSGGICAAASVQFPPRGVGSSVPLPFVADNRVRSSVIPSLHHLIKGHDLGSMCSRKVLKQVIVKQQSGKNIIISKKFSVNMAD
jgi:hypothetical protein